MILLLIRTSQNLIISGQWSKKSIAHPDCWQTGYDRFRNYHRTYFRHHCAPFFIFAAAVLAVDYRCELMTVCAVGEPVEFISILLSAIALLDEKLRT